jgi:hypothetical protein
MQRKAYYCKPLKNSYIVKRKLFIEKIKQYNIDEYNGRSTQGSS